ncbi:MAG TPA: hypothetical protein VEH06_15880 [Candidatus Bathyarchaeia archaeon]|nr:hypothetical protein [Candidatus Bathyarchaeia archaeon]
MRFENGNGELKFLFSNPSHGTNTCDIQGKLTFGGKTSCNITQGNSAKLSYFIDQPNAPAQASGNTGVAGGASGSANGGNANGGLGGNANGGNTP